MEFAGVVDLIDKAWKIGGHVFESFVIHQIDGLDLKGLHKALGLGIVIGIATSGHRADETTFGQQVAIGLGGVLRTTCLAMAFILRKPGSVGQFPTYKLSTVRGTFHYQELLGSKLDMTYRERRPCVAYSFDNVKPYASKWRALGGGGARDRAPNVFLLFLMRAKSAKNWPLGDLGPGPSIARLYRRNRAGANLKLELAKSLPHNCPPMRLFAELPPLRTHSRLDGR